MDDIHFKNHVLVVLFRNQLSVHKGTSVCYHLLGGHITADAFHATLGEEDDVIVEVDSLADAADSVYLVYRPERHGKGFRYPDMSQNWSGVTTEGTALLMCVKNRQGAMNGEEMLAFDAATTMFYQKESYKPAERIAGKEYYVPF